MRKRVITGWANKDWNDDVRVAHGNDWHALPRVWATKSDETCWVCGDWPPRKVRITIEDITKGKK